MQEGVHHRPVCSADSHDIIALSYDIRQRKGNTMKKCPICEDPITEDNPATSKCPSCKRMKCENCDMGVGTECLDCECEDDPDLKG